jgi:hypothetical protein
LREKAAGWQVRSPLLEIALVLVRLDQEHIREPSANAIQNDENNSWCFKKFHLIILGVKALIPLIGSVCLGTVIGWLIRYFIRRFRAFTPKVFGALLTALFGVSFWDCSTTIQPFFGATLSEYLLASLLTPYRGWFSFWGTMTGVMQGRAVKRNLRMAELPFIIHRRKRLIHTDRDRKCVTPDNGGSEALGNHRWQSRQSRLELGLRLSDWCQRANDVDCRRTPRRREAFRYCAEIGHLLVVQQCTELGTCRDKQARVNQRIEK